MTSAIKATPSKYGHSDSPMARGSRSHRYGGRKTTWPSQSPLPARRITGHRGPGGCRGLETSHVVSGQTEGLRPLHAGRDLQRLHHQSTITGTPRWQVGSPWPWSGGTKTSRTLDRRFLRNCRTRKPARMPWHWNGRKRGWSQRAVVFPRSKRSTSQGTQTRLYAEARLCSGNGCFP